MSEFDWDNMVATEAAPAEGQPAEATESPDAETAATAPERPRDPETGRFLPTTEDPQVQGETVEQAEALLAGKYKTTEALEQAYLEAQQLLGSLRSDQGELRSQLEQLTQAVQSQQQRPQPVQDFNELVDSDPQAAALYALSVGDRNAYDYAKSQWEALSPGTPAVWEQQLQLQQQLQALTEQLNGVAAPVAEQQNLRVVADVWRNLASTIPDFEQLQASRSEVVTEMAQSGFDWATPALESGDPKKIQAALVSLTQLARARASGNLVDQARAAGVAHVEATEQAKREAIVGSASTSMSEPPAKTPGQALADSWASYDITALRDS